MFELSYCESGINLVRIAKPHQPGASPGSQICTSQVAPDYKSGAAKTAKSSKE